MPVYKVTVSFKEVWTTYVKADNQEDACEMAERVVPGQDGTEQDTELCAEPHAEVEPVSDEVAAELTDEKFWSDELEEDENGSEA